MRVANPQTGYTLAYTITIPASGPRLITARLGSSTCVVLCHPGCSHQAVMARAFFTLQGLSIIEDWGLQLRTVSREAARGEPVEPPLRKSPISLDPELGWCARSNNFRTNGEKRYSGDRSEGPATPEPILYCATSVGIYCQRRFSHGGV